MKLKRLPGRGWELARHYVWSAFKAANTKHRFDDVQTFCMFIGYPRSGHTLVGSLLDAHRHIVTGLELDALRYVKFGFSRRQLFSLLAENSERHAEQGRQWTGYSYQVPNQWQGRVEKLQVIGDKRGGDSSRRLAKDFSLFEKLRLLVGVPLKVVHVVRNPYDNTTTMTVRKDSDNLSAAIDEYVMMVDVVERVRKQVPADSFITVHHEDIILQPKTELQRLCSFLGVDAPPEYLSDCASILFESPKQTRNKIVWGESELKRVSRLCSEHDFLRRYSYVENPVSGSKESGEN